MEVAHGQSQRIASLTAAIQDTALWDPSTCPRPSSCSTPNIHSSWDEVEVHGQKRDSEKTIPRLNLSNRYAALSADILVPSADADDRNIVTVLCL